MAMPRGTLMPPAVYPLAPERTAPELENSVTLDELMTQALPEPSMTIR